MRRKSHDAGGGPSPPPDPETEIAVLLKTAEGVNRISAALSGAHSIDDLVCGSGHPTPAKRRRRTPLLTTLP